MDTPFTWQSVFRRGLSLFSPESITPHLVQAAVKIEVGRLPMLLQSFLQLFLKLEKKRKVL